MQQIEAPRAWAAGATGRGVVVALLDTGVDVTHPDLATRWRGDTGAWFDPYGEHPDKPIDQVGHGTQILGIILGQTTGVAPEAQWIAARIFDDRGRATTEAIHAALRWALDPDGNPATADAPHILNASWSTDNVRCNPEFAEDLRALQAVGILPVFAAGAGEAASPANLPEAFAVGAITLDGQLTLDSPRGPSACGIPFPHLVAPGEAIPTTDRLGLFTTVEGTSAAAAHVSGALALMLSVQPRLSAEEQAAVLRETATDLGQPGLDNEFGAGRLNVGRAVERLQNPTAVRWLGIGMIIIVSVVGLLWRMRRRPNDEA